MSGKRFKNVEEKKETYEMCNNFNCIIKLKQLLHFCNPNQMKNSHNFNVTQYFAPQLI